MRYKFIHSMRFRIWLIFMGFTILILGFLYVNQIVFLPNFYNFIKTQETTSTAKILKDNWDNEIIFEEANRLAAEHEMRIDIDRYINGNRVTFYTSDEEDVFGKIAIDYNRNNSRLEALLNSKNGVISDIVLLEGRQTLCYAVLVGTKNNVQGYITIYNFLQPLANTQDVLKSQFFLSTFVIIILAFLLSAFIVFGISQPIIKISQSAKKLTTGEFEMKTRRVDYEEIKTLAENLNKASREIAKTENLRKDLLANVSHDLKTPLTMIKAYAEMVRDLSGDNPEKRIKHISVIIDEADRLNGLVTDMLNLSKLQSGVASKELEIFDFSEHLNDIIKRFSYLFDEHKINILLKIKENILVKADLSKIEQVVYNLVNNSINHTGNHGEVVVSLYRKKEKIGRFEVRDTGAGIAKDELPYIWERYYKAEKSELHQRTAVGTGLGLSIVKGIMEIHGYAYGADSTLGKGSTFWFEFPCE